jgi:photosystem II stability/assembly factor-like uncharacterized protein
MFRRFSIKSKGSISEPVIRMKPQLQLARLFFFTAFLIGAPATSLAQEGWVPTRVGPVGQDLNTVFFLDSKRGWVGGDNGFLSRTDDGGRAWVQQVVGTKDAINDIYFRDKEDGFLLAGNAIFVSRDSGTRWTEVRRFLSRDFDGASVELYSVRFPSKKRGWVVGSVSKRDVVIDSILVYTEDGGENWQRRRAPSRLELIHLDFDNDKRGWIAGAGGTILKTDDGGLTWIKQESGTAGTIYHVDIRNEKRGWAVGERGLILRTTDGGQHWEPITGETRSTLLSVEFLNDDDGWAVGRGGTILRSSDGGRTWIEQAASTKANLYALHFQKKIGWAVGADGLVLRYDK